VPEPAAPASVILAKVGALTWSERRVLIEAALLIGVLQTALRACGLRRVQRMLAATLPLPACQDVIGISDRQRAVAISRLVDVAARHTVKNTCLHRSLALWWLLGRRRVASQIRIGTRRHDGRFDAHAWVELDGIVINDTGDPGYAPLNWPPLEHEA
jgi:transglutaminase superfamily protein